MIINRNGLNIEQKLLPVSRYTHGDDMAAVEWVVIHWQGNAGKTRKFLRNWFRLIGQGKVGNRYASCHYVVGLEGQVDQLIDEDTVAFCNGGRSYTPLAKEFMRYRNGRVRPNDRAISIEVCHPDRAGKFTENAERAVAKLAADCLYRHGLGVNHCLRHYDITHKSCPRYYVDNPGEWARLNFMISRELVDLRLGGKRES